MIITTPEELSALLPANVLTSPESLLTLMEQTERTHIVPLLGRPLYDAVCQEYNKLHHGTALDANGKALTANDLVATEAHHLGYVYTPMQQLIKLLQVPLVYMTLANKSGILSVSLNDGGMNIVSSEDYSSAKKEDRESFSRDCFRDAHEGMEQVLLFLEEDAHADSPVFLELWSKSSTFYLQYGLIVPTAHSFHKMVPIDNSRERYLTLVQRIRFVQDNKLRPELGETMVDALVQFAAFGAQDKTRTDTGTFQFFSEADSPFEEDLRPFLPVKRYDGITTQELLKLRGWKKLLSFLQFAVCFYVEHDDKKLHRKDSEKDAMLMMERAKHFISDNTALFEGVIEDSPLFVPEPADTPNESNTCHRPEPFQHGGVFDPLGAAY